MGVIADMIRAGVDPDLIGRVHEEIVAAAKHAPAERTARQERNARYYANKASEKRLKASNSDDSDAVAPEENASREEYNTTRAPAVVPVGISNEIPKLDNPLPTVGPLKPKAPTPKEILSEVVSEKTAADVIAHRKALRKPLTPRAAELLAKSLAASGDAERAAATMIERGWQGYRADWDTPNARAGPRQEPRFKNGFAAVHEEIINGKFSEGDDNFDCPFGPAAGSVQMAAAQAFEARGNAGGPFLDLVATRADDAGTAMAGSAAERSSGEIEGRQPP